MVTPGFCPANTPPPSTTFDGEYNNEITPSSGKSYW